MGKSRRLFSEGCYKKIKKFPAITKIQAGGILTKNLVTFKRWDGVEDEKLLTVWGFTEKSDFYGSVHKNQQGLGIRPIYKAAGNLLVKLVINIGWTRLSPNEWPNLNLPYTQVWNTVVTSGLVPLVDTWNC